MSICIAIAVPDGIALAADSQTTWNKTINQATQRGTNQVFDLAEPINVPISWSKMARKLFNLNINENEYAICIAGIALLNHKTIYSIFKSLEKSYDGDGSYDNVVRHFLDGIKTELRKQLNIENLAEAQQVLNVEFIVSSHINQDVSKPRIESWLVISGTITVNEVPLTTGEYNKWTNIVDGHHTFGGCWIGRTEFISHLVTHTNAKMPPIQGQYELLSLADAVDYTQFLVDFTCDYQRFAAMVPDCGKPIISSTLTPERYEEKIIK
ncbi:hypothetical protein [Muricauda sp. MAR_2010_75]|uniref:hypothetical protein n=1 Tax=Allomuricauda sp. MAR_2010_75 TaxID=1250232 RepID=UPI00055B024D|nr:hypothetical protein [Muricauda sp. MAR_2010_75]